MQDQFLKICDLTILFVYGRTGIGTVTLKPGLFFFECQDLLLNATDIFLHKIHPLL